MNPEMDNPPKTIQLTKKQHGIIIKYALLILQMDFLKRICQFIESRSVSFLIKKRKVSGVVINAMINIVSTRGEAVINVFLNILISHINTIKEMTKRA